MFFLSNFTKIQILQYLLQKKLFNSSWNHFFSFFSLLASENFFITALSFFFSSNPIFPFQYLISESNPIFPHYSTQSPIQIQSFLYSLKTIFDLTHPSKSFKKSKQKKLFSRFSFFWIFSIVLKTNFPFSFINKKKYFILFLFQIINTFLEVFWLMA